MDDDVSIGNLCRMLLTRLGYTVDIALNEQEALAHHERVYREGGRYLAVILDMSINGRPAGAEVLRSLRARTPRIHAILASGGATGSDEESEARAMGFDDTLPKPFLLTDLKRVLDRARAGQSYEKDPTLP